MKDATQITDSFGVEGVGRISVVVQTDGDAFDPYTKVLTAVVMRLRRIADTEGPRLAAEKTGASGRNGRTPVEPTPTRSVEVGEHKLAYHLELTNVDQKMVDSTLVLGLLDILDEAAEQLFRDELEKVEAESSHALFEDPDRAADELEL